MPRLRLTQRRTSICMSLSFVGLPASDMVGRIASDLCSEQSKAES